jgi:hypothetical protein
MDGIQVRSASSAGELDSNEYFLTFEDVIEHSGSPALRSDAGTSKAQVTIFKGRYFGKALHPTHFIHNYASNKRSITGLGIFQI